MMKKSVLGLAAFLCATAAAAAKLDTPLWEAGGLRTPESVLVHVIDGRKVLLVSEIEGDPARADGAGGIALLDTDGSILERDYVRGLNAPKGMAVHGNTLFVSDIDAVAAIDLTTRKVIARQPVQGAAFLNDVAVDDKGTVYVSDSRTGKVHRMTDGVIETWLENIEGVNGLYAANGDLLIGTAKSLLRARDGKVVEVAKGFESGIDGVEALSSGGFVVTCWTGLVYRVSEKGKVTKLLDTRGRDPQLNTADIGYDKEAGVVYIPTFLSNGVRAYALK
jgi:sugar lactone lactonase YvrE